MATKLARQVFFRSPPPAPIHSNQILNLQFNICPDSERDWASLNPDLLALIFEKVELRWAVAIAGTCRRWRVLMLQMCPKLNSSGLLVFPANLRDPGPAVGNMQCLMVRKGKIFSVYAGSGLDHRGLRFLMSAQLRWRPSGYVCSIGTHRVGSSTKNGPVYLGTLKPKLRASEFILWDYSLGTSSSDHLRKRIKYPVFRLKFMEHVVNDTRQRRLSCVLYESMQNLQHWLQDLEKEDELCKGSKKLSWICSQVHDFSSETEGLLRRRRSNISKSFSNMEGHEIRSKIPVWSAERQCWSLDFHGRATMPSIHNLQLVARTENDEQIQDQGSNSSDSIVLQMGKVGKDAYTMDFSYPISPFQAFGICLTSFASNSAKSQP